MKIFAFILFAISTFIGVWLNYVTEFSSPIDQTTAFLIPSGLIAVGLVGTCATFLEPDEN